jgi:hypothetical protein
MIPLNGMAAGSSMRPGDVPITMASTGLGRQTTPKHNTEPAADRTFGEPSASADQPSLFEHLVLELLGFNVLTTDGNVGRRSQLAAYLVLGFIAIILALGLIVFAYIAKTIIGIDLMAGHSPLHFIADGIGFH